MGRIDRYESQLLTALIALLLCSVLYGCRKGDDRLKAQTAAASAASQQRDEYRLARQQMVEDHLRSRDIVDPTVLQVMARVPRHRYVPERLRSGAYGDHPLPIGEGQTISQPYIVAYMTQALELDPTDRVLEIGTGSGYQAAVLAEIATQVYTIEIISSLAENARSLLAEIGYDNVHVRSGDGYFGWPEAAPFDAIIVTAAPPRVPQALVDQLGDGAHLVIPVGEHYQELIRITRAGSEIRRERMLPVRFVPMTGEAQEKE